MMTDILWLNVADEVYKSNEGHLIFSFSVHKSYFFTKPLSIRSVSIISGLFDIIFIAVI